MQLDDAQLDSFESWLEIKQAHRRCPACGHESKMVAAREVYALGCHKEPDREACFLVLSCADCGAVQLFCAELVGLSL
jgi:hypothetical protein